MDSEDDLNQAVQYGDMDGARDALAKDSHPDKNRYGNALLKATQSGHLGIIELLLAEGANTEITDAYLNRPAHIAASNDRGDIIDVLAAYDAKLDSRNNLGNTPLHSAALNDGPEATKALIAARALLTTKNDAGETPGTLAEKSGSPHAKKLLDEAMLRKHEVEAQHPAPRDDHAAVEKRRSGKKKSVPHHSHS